MTKKSMVSLWLENVPQDKVFMCHDGSMIRNIGELAAALRGMSMETFRYHVTGVKNDFSNWVSDVIGDVILAKQLQSVATPTSAARRVEKRLVWLKARL